jgi:glyoxylase-like metal-dependent hydrolase (beta-lactamase superfamily II)
MTELNRRHLMAGTAAAGLAAALPAIGHAAAPAAGKQAPGFYRYKVGSIEITVVTDGANRFPIPDGFVANASKEQINAALAANFMEQGFFTGPYNPIVINTGSKLALVDTGTSEATLGPSKGATGQLMMNLAAAGIDANAIDTVIISHYHGDHINGLLKADKSLAFPNAEILVPAAEHQYYMDDGIMSRAPKGRIEGVFNNVRRVIAGDVLKRLRTYEMNKDVIPGVLAVATPGHTPGHTSHVVSSGDSKVYVQADVTHAPYLFARNPGWHPFYDQDPVMAEATRRKVYDMLAAEKMRVQGFHYPFPSHGFVEKTGTGYREIPVPWNPTI